MSLTFPVLTAFKLNWTVTDADGNGVNNAAVIATLFAGRSRTNPTALPGTPVPPIVALPLTYVPDSVGVYSAAVPATLNPAQSAAGFVVVVDASVSSTNIYHAEEAVVLETDGSPLDLTTVDQVKDWMSGMGGINAADDQIQLCITAWSIEFMRLTGTGDQNGNYTQSPFTAVCNWSEVYDGNGSTRLFLRNRPVRAVTSLTMNNAPLRASGTNPLVSGYVIDGSGKSISLRGGGFGSRSFAWPAGPYRALTKGGVFLEGVQNVYVQYVAGYDTTPADIVDAANNMVQLNYKRKGHIDEKSRAVSGGGGTIVWADWDIPVGVQSVIDNYARIG
jgi:hypothetical protein